jgi:hypothetical protein
MTLPYHSSWLDHSNNVCWSSSLCKLLQFCVALSVLGPNVFLSTLISNILSLCSSLSVRVVKQHSDYVRQKHFACPY